MAKTKTELAWEKIFNKYDIITKIESDGYFIITADQIKEFREPRLATKFDHNINLPSLFKRHKISIMPLSRYEYVLSNHQMFFQIDIDTTYVEQKILPGYLESITKDSITSEAVALNCSYITGMISDFLQDDEIVPTVSGRMTSGTFKFNIYNSKKDDYDELDVTNSQIEIDAAYEGLHSLALIEAKQTISTDFLVRQLYYPYRAWKDRVNKTIRPIYMVYSNSIFTFNEYTFDDPDNYNSLRLVRTKSYTLEDTEINMEVIQNILNNADIVDEPDIPFPQADDFKKVINLCELAQENYLTKDFIASEYEFNIRQSDYYGNACRYLGLMNREKIGRTSAYVLSENGKSMLRMSYVNRQIYLTQKILEHKTFNDALKLWLENAVPPTKAQIISIMQENGLYNVGSRTEESSTFERRASSIRGWIEWILSIIE